MKVQQLLDDIASLDLVLPEFQREYVWTKEQAKQLMVSLYKDYPVGSLLFWKTDEHDLDRASSGRLTLWSHNLCLFADLPLYAKMLGSGLGSESKTVLGGEDQIWSSHNDYISLLMTQGLIGLLLYGAIICVLVRDIIHFGLDRKMRAVFLLPVLTVTATSMLTNGYISRFELSQMF